MYFAHMYCYGSDTNTVGITGIKGCMGVVYKGQGAMFAVHIPDNNAATNKTGGEAFARYVRNNQQVVGKGHGHLFVFLNGTNRSSAEDEGKAIKKLLKNPATSLYRIMKHLGPNSGTHSADSVAIFVENVQAAPSNPAGAAIWYKRNDIIQWVSGGKTEAGQYKAMAAFQGDLKPSELNSHWWRIDDSNSTLTTI